MRTHDSTFEDEGTRGEEALEPCGPGIAIPSRFIRKTNRMEGDGADAHVDDVFVIGRFFVRHAFG